MFLWFLHMSFSIKSNMGHSEFPTLKFTWGKWLYFMIIPWIGCAPLPAIGLRLCSFPFYRNINRNYGPVAPLQPMDRKYYLSSISVFLTRINWINSWAKISNAHHFQHMFPVPVAPCDLCCTSTVRRTRVTGFTWDLSRKGKRAATLQGSQGNFSRAVGAVCISPSLYLYIRNCIHTYTLHIIYIYNMHMYVYMYSIYIYIHIYIYVHIIPRVPSSSSSSPILGVSQGFMQTLQGELLNTTVYPPLYLIFTKRLGARGTAGLVWL